MDNCNGFSNGNAMQGERYSRTNLVHKEPALGNHVLELVGNGVKFVGRQNHGPGVGVVTMREEILDLVQDARETLLEEGVVATQVLGHV